MNTTDGKAPPSTEERTVVPTTRARQGATGHNVRYVLLAATAGMVVLFTVVYIAYFG